MEDVVEERDNRDPKETWYHSETMLCPITSCDLADKLPDSSGSHCHFHLHSKIPGTYVSCSNLDALPAMPSTVMSHCFRIFQIMEDIQPRPYLLL